MPYTTPRTWTAGELVTAAMMNAEVRDNIANGVFHKIAEATGASATYDFTSIPQLYRSYAIVTNARGDTAATTVSLRMRLQNISTASYYDQSVSGAAATVTGAEVIAGTSGRIGLCSAASAAATLTGTTFTILPNVLQANKEKAWISISVGIGGLTTGTLTCGVWGGIFDSTSAIDRITILPSAGNFVADGVCTVYGLPF